MTGNVSTRTGLLIRTRLNLLNNLINSLLHLPSTFYGYRKSEPVPLLVFLFLSIPYLESEPTVNKVLCGRCLVVENIELLTEEQQSRETHPGNNSIQPLYWPFLTSSRLIFSGGPLINLDRYCSAKINVAAKIRVGLIAHVAFITPTMGRKF